MSRKLIITVPDNQHLDSQIWDLLKDLVDSDAFDKIVVGNPSLGGLDFE